MGIFDRIRANLPSPFVPSGGGGGSTSPLTTKGDVWGYSTVDARIPIGTNGHALIADSAQTLGLKWAAVTASASGSTGEVQFNSSSALAADNNFFWDNTNKRLGLGNSSPSYLLDIKPITDAIALRIQSGGTGNGATFDMDASAHGGKDYRIFSTGSTNGDVGGNVWGVRDTSVSGVTSYRIYFNSSGSVTFGAYGAGFSKFDASGNISSVLGASGSFTTVDSKTVTVVDGLITSIV